MSLIEMILDFILSLFSRQEEDNDDGNDGNGNGDGGNEEKPEPKPEPIIVTIDFNKLKGLKETGDLKYSVENTKSGQISGVENYKVWWRSDL